MAPDAANPFTKTAEGGWQAEADSRLRLTQDVDGYTLTLLSGVTERYDLNGRLVLDTDLNGRVTTYTHGTDGLLTTVTGPFGHRLTFTYATNYRIATVTDPAGQTYSYAYTGNRLTKVTYPDNTARIYHYEYAPFPNHLTGISLDNGQGSVRRLSTYAYDSTGRAILTQHADTGNGGPQEKFTFTYNSATQTTVTDAAGTPEVLTFAETLGVKNPRQ